MYIDVSKASVVDVYHMLVGLVSPRPIAWVSTINDRGLVNLAPFSFFNCFGANPPVVVFSPTRRRNGTKKDTLLNVEANGQFVIHAATANMAERINATSKEIASEESELDLIDVTTTPSTLVKPPRISEAAFALECEVIQIVPVGDGPISANLVIGKVVCMHVDDNVLGDDHLPDPTKLQSIARMGGSYWCRTTDLFSLQRP